MNFSLQARVKVEQLSDTSPQNLPEHQTCGLVQQKKMRRFCGKFMHFFAENPKSPFPPTSQCTASNSYAFAGTDFFVWSWKDKNLAEM